jgi:DNA-binding NarL/FixJ family response regulator
LLLDIETDMTRFYEKYNISNREQEIVNLILKGKSNKEIEDTLFISLKTVKNHVYKVFKKVGVQTRGQLIIKIMNFPKSG